MIASLTGHIQSVGTDHVVIDVNGVGYLVMVSARTAEKLRPRPVADILLGQLAPDSRTFLFIETQVREESITLHGFLTTQERDWFRLFTGIQGVGPKAAFAILATIPPQDLAGTIMLEDKAMIARANGVGPRLAARIVTELKGKIGPDLSIAGPTGLSAAPPTPASPAAEALSALTNLGYRPAEAARAVAEAERDLGDALPLPDLIREALKRASR